MIAYRRWDAGGAGDDVIVVANFSAKPFASYRARPAARRHLDGALLLERHQVLARLPGTPTGRRRDDRDGARRLRADGLAALGPYQVLILVAVDSLYSTGARVYSLARMRGLPRTFWYLWTGALINRLGAFVYTFLALYLTRGAPLHRRRSGRRHRVVGHRRLRRRVPSAASSPISVGRRRTMLLGVHASAAAMVHLGPGALGWHIAVATALLGFCGNLFRPAMHATVADVVPPADRTRAYGYLYWAVNLGFAGAAMLGGFMAERNFTLLFVADAATTLALRHHRLPARARDASRAPHRRSHARPTCACRCAIGRSSSSSFAQLLVMLVGSQGSSTLPIDLRDHGISPSTYGWLLAINGVIIVAFQPTAVGVGAAASIAGACWRSARSCKASASG